MPIIMNGNHADLEAQQMPPASEIQWDVWIGDGDGEGFYEWYATCDTLDEAVELTQQKVKKFYVNIQSEVRKK